jgi:hypothetical protein
MGLGLREGNVLLHEKDHLPKSTMQGIKLYHALRV